MGAITIKDLVTSRALDSQAMSQVRGGRGGWVAGGWIVPFVGSTSVSSGNGIIYNITNNVFNQFINAGQATFQTQNTDVFNSGANAVIDVGANQASEISRR